MFNKKLILKKTHDFCAVKEPRLTVVFIHGIASDSSSFTNALKYLEGTTSLKDIRFVAFDLLGSGQSRSDDNLNYEIVDDAIYVEKDKAYIKVTNSYYDAEDEVYIIEAYLENTSLDDYISLSFNLYDKDGVVLGSAIGDVTLNKEDKRYKIKSVYYDNDAGLVSSYKITDIYGN